MVEVRNQHFVIARLADYCDFHHGFGSDVRDPVLYMWEKLKEIEGPMYSLKQDLLRDAISDFFRRLGEGEVSEDEIADFKQLLDGYLRPGDFADAVFHLHPPALADQQQRRMAEDFFRDVTAHRMIEEENKPEDRRNPNWKRLVADIYRRLELDLLDKVRKHKPLSHRRLRFILRRCRFNTAEYCTVFHFPVHPGDTFTPFIVPRVEALVAANMRFLRNLRRG
ncbi:hypothetical protein ACFL2T_05075 [Elusimicrobiota bacterium]